MMDVDKYFVVSMNEDGEWSISEFDTAEQIIGEYDLNNPEDYTTPPAENFRTTIDDYNPGSVIIKGKIVLPTAKKVTTKWEIE